jgi:hypothetical protein
MLDAVYNFAKAKVSTGYDQNAFTITLQSGQGTNFPSGEFNVVWWNSSDYPDPSDDPNREIDRVQSISGDVVTLVNNGTSRIAQETSAGGLAASTKNNAGKTYTMMLAVTAQMMLNIGSNLQKPWRLVSLVGAIDGVNTEFTLNGSIAPFDSNSLDVKLARQPQEQGIDYTFSGVTVTYVVPPDPSLAGQPHTAKYQ